MKISNLILVMALLIGLASCSPISVKTDYDREADFANYKTYRWLRTREGKPMTAKNPLMAKRMRRAIEGELSAKGYHLVEDEKPDFLVAFYSGVRNKVDVTTYGYRYGRWGRWRGTAVAVDRYKEGTLIIDIIDSNEKELVWRGWASGTVENPNKAQETINKAVAKLLSKFPPK